jgi:hypothetical protein
VGAELASSPIRQECCCIEGLVDLREICRLQRRYLLAEARIIEMPSSTSGATLRRDHYGLVGPHLPCLVWLLASDHSRVETEAIQAAQHVWDFPLVTRGLRKGRTAVPILLRVATSLSFKVILYMSTNSPLRIFFTSFAGITGSDSPRIKWANSSKPSLLGLLSPPPAVYCWGGIFLTSTLL